LDTIGEELHDDDLYSALLVALDPATPLRICTDDGGYLSALVERCRVEVGRLTSYAEVRPVALQAAARCGAAQTRTHAVQLHGSDELRRWAEAQRVEDDYLWWEVSAGAISSLAVHATLAVAAMPESTLSDAVTVDRAYFPSICAVSTLLDCAIDEEVDQASPNHRTNDYYDDAAHALARLEDITQRAAADARALPSGRRHVVILAGMTALYAVSDRRGDELLHGRVSRAVGAATSPIMWTLRLRRRLRGGPDRAALSQAL
jgi:tetraprenyl-beta-curcumene synthase